MILKIHILRHDWIYSKIQKFIPDDNSMKTQIRFTQFSFYRWYYLSSTIVLDFFIFLETWLEQSYISIVNSVHKTTYQICIYIITFQ